MNAGETIVWCVGLICLTIFACIVTVGLFFRKSEKEDVRR